jgi:putative lipoic acid-binding regulatory protein
MTKKTPDLTSLTELSTKELTDSLIEYPCDFPIKVFGQQNVGFAKAVMEVVSQHDPDFSAASIEMRASKTARYISLTCTVRATSREQLDALYQDLCDHPMIVMVL